MLNWQHIRNCSYYHLRKGEIWWCHVGENVGVEINGKHDFYERPALVFRKLSKHSFLAVPLTSQPHKGTWYVEFNFRQKKNFAVLSQVRVMSAKRLTGRMGELTQGDYKKVKEGFKRLYNPK